MSYTPIVYFISTTYLRQNTPIEDNVDDDKILPYIVQAQQTMLQEGIGETGMNALNTAVQNNTLTPDEQAFMRNYVQPLVAQYAFYLMFPFLNWKSTNKAISKESSEFSTPADLDEIKYLRSSILDMAQFYKRRMVKYLLDHPAMFIWYSNPDDLDNLPKTAQSYFTGVYMPRGGVRGGNIMNWYEPYGNIYPCGFGPCWDGNC
jgi:hypothetical protein